MNTRHRGNQFENLVAKALWGAHNLDYIVATRRSGSPADLIGFKLGSADLNGLLDLSNYCGGVVCLLVQCKRSERTPIKSDYKDLERFVGVYPFYVFVATKSRVSNYATIYFIGHTGPELFGMLDLDWHRKVPLVELTRGRRIK